jgi:hypothetical protein
MVGCWSCGGVCKQHFPVGQGIGNVVPFLMFSASDKAHVYIGRIDVGFANVCRCVKVSGATQQVDPKCTRRVGGRWCPRAVLN